MRNDIAVSIICNAYNHEAYIRDALESFIMQKTNFKFEVLVHDDASTDKTADIIREYEQKYPEIIKPIYQTENQYSQGKSISSLYQYPRVKGKYIAVCEGDDYWTDELKLQKQFEALETHPDVDICAHTVSTVNAQTKETISAQKPSDTDCIFTPEEVILGNGGFVGTNSLIYRASLNDNIPEFRKMYMLDYMVQIHGALRGGMLYLADDMSAYRSFSQHSWTVRMSKNIQQYVAHLEKVNAALNKLDDYTDKKYSVTINSVIHAHNFGILIAKKEYSKVCSAEYKDLFKKLSLKAKMGMRFPILFKIKEMLKK